MGSMAAQKQRGASPASRPARRGKHTVNLITDAKRSRLEGWHHRRRLYAVLQLMRLPVLMAAGIAMWLTNNVALSVAIAVISLPLPWVAVLLANETGEVDKQERKIYKPAVVRANREAMDLNRGLHSGTHPQRALETSRTESSGDREIIIVDADDDVTAGDGDLKSSGAVVTNASETDADVQKAPRQAEDEPEDKE